MARSVDGGRFVPSASLERNGGTAEQRADESEKAADRAGQAGRLFRWRATDAMIMPTLVARSPPLHLLEHTQYPPVLHHAAYSVDCDRVKSRRSSSTSLRRNCASSTIRTGSSLDS